MSAGSTPSAGGTFRALRHRNFRLLWLGQAGHASSLWMDQVARAVLVLELTDSAFMLSLVIAARLAPILVFGLIAGALADRADKKRLLTITQAISMTTHLFLAVMILTGLIEVWQVFATAIVAGTAMAFNQPVRQSLIPMSVPRDDLMNAVALNSMALSFTRVAGASMAGALLIFLDLGGIYLINVGIYALVILTTLMMRFPAREPAALERPGLLTDLKEGFAYVGSNSNLALVTGLALILYIFGFPYQQVFVPLLAKETLDLGNSGIGFLAGATGVGALIGSIVVAARSDTARPALIMILNMIIFGGALVVISLQNTLAATALLLALAGGTTVAFTALTNGILLANSDPKMHGRVMSLLSLDRGLIPLGSIAAGALASTYGVRPGLFVMGALVTVLSAATLALAGRRIARIGYEGEAVRVASASTVDGTPGEPRVARAAPRS